MKKKGISISIQISIFLILVAFIPVAVMMALNTYEKQQLSMLENSNVQQGRLVAAALETNLENQDYAEYANTLLKNMDDKFDSRIRILTENGTLVADSASLEKQLELEENSSAELTLRNPPKNKKSSDAEKSFIYRVFSFPVRVYRKLFRPPVATLYDTAEFYSKKTVYDGEEVRQALQGKYGATTRISSGEQISVTIYSALPVMKDGQVLGAVLVSRSTYRILQNLYELRLDLAKIFLRSLIAVCIIALFLALRITRPLKKLSKQASQCADKKGRLLFTDFTGKKRRDEIGELSRSFSALINKLNSRIRFSEAFSSDISHEFKNPLTAIRSSAELLSDETITESERKELSGAVVEEVEHLQSLLTGVRNISKIDAEQDFTNDNIALVPYFQNQIERLEKLYPHVKFGLYTGGAEGKVTTAGSVSTASNLATADKFAPEGNLATAEKLAPEGNLSPADTLRTADSLSTPSPLSLLIPEDYLSRLSENLLDNAAGFGDKINIHLAPFTTKATPKSPSKQFIEIKIEDNGPGVKDEEKEKIFGRFYSQRQENQKSSHTGLGLSIVKAIVDSLEGEISVSNSEELGGACFTVLLPK